MITLKNSSKAMCIVVAAVAVGLLPCAVSAGGTAYPSWELLSIGQPKPSAIGLRVWTDKEAGKPFKKGDRLIITVQADRNAYLTVVCISSRGNVTVLVPNKDNRNGLLKKGEPYTLFGDDSRLRLTLGKQINKPGLVFYLSSKPPRLDSFKRSKQTGLYTIARDSGKEIKALKGVIEEASREEGFNRVLFSATGNGKKYFEVRLKEGPERLMGGARPMIQKKLPTSIDSTPPETVTGVQGVKPETPEQE